VLSPWSTPSTGPWRAGAGCACCSRAGNNSSARRRRCPCRDSGWSSGTRRIARPA